MDQDIKEFENGDVRIWMRKDNIIQVEIKEMAEIDAVRAREMVDAVEEMSQGKKRSLLIFNDNPHSLDSQARSVLYDSDTIAAAAIVAKTSLGRIIGNFMIGMRPHPWQAKIFNDHRKAEKWLRQFL